MTNTNTKVGGITRVKPDQTKELETALIKLEALERVHKRCISSKVELRLEIDELEMLIDSMKNAMKEIKSSVARMASAIEASDGEDSFAYKLVQIHKKYVDSLCDLYML